MTTCPRCGEEYGPADLKRHEREGIHTVHCPGCGCHLGTYNEHAR